MILLFALPLYIGQQCQLLYGLIDTRIIGSAMGEDASIIAVTEEPGKDGMTVMKLSGHGRDFTNMSSFINYCEDGTYLEANLSLMEPNGEFDLL